MAGQEVIKDAISNFFCSKNTDVETFLKTKAINFELRNRSRTYLIIDKQDLVKNRLYNIYGYFTIALKTLDLEKEVSNGKRKQLNGFVYLQTQELIQMVRYLPIESEE